MNKPGDPWISGCFHTLRSGIRGVSRLTRESAIRIIKPRARNTNSFDFIWGDETGMKGIHRRLDSIAVIAMVVAPLLITIYLLFLSPNDLSASQTGKQRILGATYMTMNNPYFQVLDAQIQALLELRGDVLLTRDAAMDQERQNQEIQELVDAGVCAIFMTPVEWDTSKEGVQIAAAAGVPVIVVDAPIQASELAACSVLSDNYQAGVLCARHLLSVRSSAKILLLEHITARSGADRIQGFKDTIADHGAQQPNTSPSVTASISASVTVRLSPE